MIIKMLRRMRVARRLATGFGTVLVLMAALAGVALYGFSELHQINERLGRQVRAEVKPANEPAATPESGRAAASTPSAKAADATASESLYNTLRITIIVLGLLAIVVAVFFSRRVALMITRPISRAASVSDGIARGDLAQKIDVNHHGGELGLLLNSLQNTIYRLRELIQAVRDRAEAVQNGTNEIARGNAELSSRTEAQASTLEETAASMEEFTSSIKQNAESANQAKALAIGASEIATEGGRVVSDAVKTMTDISNASKKIADIIGVIDSIAFQTNILALNAAVEAARAGEQGRGFAVVASEVRSLAQRSAEAAKEIKLLIGDSVQKISTGAKQVQNAGNTMTEIVASVARVRDVVNEISSASREQASGIDQVNTAITHMDQSTQQNAALVEEVSATAEAMTDEVQAMMQAVGAFNLGELVLQPTFEAGRRQMAAAQNTETRHTAAPVKQVTGSLNKPPVPVLPQSSRRPAGNADDEWKTF
jgi:methyl-accepting chemotaxis protein